MQRLVTIAIAVVCLLSVGCGSASIKATGTDNTARAEGQRAAAVIPVSAVLPVRDEIREIARTSERIEAEIRIEVTSEVMGRCIEVNFEEGDSVKKGAVLARLDNSEQQAQLRQQEAQLTTTKRDWERSKELLEHGLTSPQEYDTTWSSYQQQVETVNQTKEQLTKYTIRAPISGLITMEDVQEGQIVSSGTPIYTVVDPNSYILTVPVDESELPRLKEKQRAIVRIDALGDDVFDTTVRHISHAIDPASGTVSVILDFKKEDLAKLRESAFARVELVMDTHENALLVPKEAIKEDDGRMYVFAVRELPEEEWPTASDDPIYKAERVEVLTGLENSDFIEVLDGLNEGDRVVTYGKDSLKSESFIKVTTAEVELETAASISAEEALQIAEARKERGATNRSMFTAGQSR